MSFILDQMKKAGKQRALEMAMRKQTDKPGSITAEPLAPQSADRAPVSMQKWLSAAVAVLLGAAAVYGVVVFFRSSSAIKPPVAPASKGLVQEAIQLPIVPPSNPSGQIPQAHVQEISVSKAESPAVEGKHAGAAKVIKEATVPDEGLNDRERAEADRLTGEREKRSRGAASNAPFRVDPSDSVLEFNQLPQSVRKSLPMIKLSSHLYRKDSRLVSINGRIMSEGYNMEGGLFLDEIIPEGVILSYGKYRFLVRAE